MKKPLIILCLIPLLLFGSCRISYTKDTAPVTSESALEEPETERSYDLVYDIMELYVGESFLTKELSFDSLSLEENGVASLSSDGEVITGNKAGEALLTAVKDGAKAECLIRVKKLPSVPETGESDELLPGKYRLLVNKCHNYVAVYAWEDRDLTEPLKAMICSSGENTPTGSYNLSSRKEWNRLYGGVWGKYATAITGDILFHSVPYYEKDSATLEAVEYNKLGTTASAGCIRLTVADAKWIFDHCDPGSQVVFSEEDTECPLEITPALKLHEEQCWDPTDPDPENPWIGKTPAIRWESLSVDPNEGKNLGDIFKAEDTAGNDITDRMECDGDPDLSVPGRYRLCLTVTDDLGRSARKIVTLCVRHG